MEATLTQLNIYYTTIFQYKFKVILQDHPKFWAIIDQQLMRIVFFYICLSPNVLLTDRLDSLLTQLTNYNKSFTERCVASRFVNSLVIFKLCHPTSSVVCFIFEINFSRNWKQNPLTLIKHALKLHGALS